MRISLFAVEFVTLLTQGEQHEQIKQSCRCGLGLSAVLGDWLRLGCGTGGVVVSMIKTPPPSLNKTLGAYNPLELKPFTGRPGAMDAFKLPSLIANVQVFRKDADKL
jgi:hypothetical protein